MFAITDTAVLHIGLPGAAENIAYRGAFMVSLEVVATLGSLSDQVTIFRGDNGGSAVQAVFSQESHTLPAEFDGTVISYAGSGTNIRVFEGTTELDYDGVGTAAGKPWRAVAQFSILRLCTVSSDDHGCDPCRPGSRRQRGCFPRQRGHRLRLAVRGHRGHVPGPQ